MANPEVCFCGCGEARSKLDSANLEGYAVAIELGRYVSYLAAMHQAAGGDIDEENNLASFLEDGRACWMAAYDEVHNGVKMDRLARKLSRRWRKYSAKLHEMTNRESGLPFDPFDHVATAQQVHTWVVDGALPAVDDLPDY